MILLIMKGVMIGDAAANGGLVRVAMKIFFRKYCEKFCGIEKLY